MINPLFLKGGLGFIGVGTVAGMGTAGVIYKKEISDLVSSLFKKNKKTSDTQTSESQKGEAISQLSTPENVATVQQTQKTDIPTISHDYLVVAHHVETESQNIPTENLYAGNAKKFKCEKDKDTIDDSCEIYSLNVHATKKFLNLKKTDANTNLTGKLVRGTYYKLKVDSSKFTSITYDGSYVIELKSNAKDDTKSYGKLKVLAKINDDSLTSDNKLIIAKVKKNTITDDTVDSYKCQIGASQEHELDCGIYKFEPVLTQLASLTLATSPTKLNNSLIDDLKVNNYYIIDFANETNSSKLSNLNEEDLKNTNIFVKTTDEKDSSGKAEFIEAKSFIGRYQSDSNNQVFISYTETAQ